MKKALIGVAALLIVLAVGAGAFWAGMSYGKSQARQELEGLIRERLGARGDRFPGLDQFLERDQFPQGRQESAPQFGGGIRGTIEALEGETLVVNSDEGIVKVQITDTTLIEKNMAVGMGDLEVGEMVVISGLRNDDGSVTARSVLSIRAFRRGQPSGGQ